MFRLALVRLCASVDPEIPPPITRQSYCASEEAWRHDEVVVVAVGVDIMDVGGANASVFDMQRLPIRSVDFTIVLKDDNKLFLFRRMLSLAVMLYTCASVSVFRWVGGWCFLVEVVSAKQIAFFIFEIQFHSSLEYFSEGLTNHEYMRRQSRSESRTRIVLSAALALHACPRLENE